MWDKIQGLIYRAGYAFGLPAATTTTIPAGHVGLWHNAGKLMLRHGSAPSVDSGVLTQRGIVPSARMAFSAQPANTNPMQIGDATFQFLTNLIAATTYTQIKRGTNAAATLASLLNAINGVADATVVVGSTLAAQMATTPLVADAVTGTVLRIRKADAIGGNPISGVVASTPLTCTIAAGASAWSVSDLSVTGKVETGGLCVIAKTTIEAAQVTAGSAQLEVPFTPTVVFGFVTASTGVQRASTDAITISGNAINIALAGGGSPAIQATDIVTVIALD